MKPATPIATLALVCAIAALMISNHKSASKLTDAEMDRLVDAAFARKEKLYVRELAPKMDRNYKDMLGSNYQTPEKAPETFGELFAPAISLVNHLSTGP